MLIKESEQVKESDSPKKENKEKEPVIKKEKESPINKRLSIKSEKMENNIIQKFLNKQREINNKDKDSDEDPILTQPVTILIYSIDKKESIEYRPNKTIRELINHLNFYNFEIFLCFFQTEVDLPEGYNLIDLQDDLNFLNYDFFVSLYFQFLI